VILQQFPAGFLIDSMVVCKDDLNVLKNIFRQHLHFFPSLCIEHITETKSCFSWNCSELLAIDNV